MTGKRLLIIGLLCLMAGAALAQSTPPDPVQIYRTIKFTSDEQAGDVRWIEIWETQAGDDRQWVMVDLQGTPDGVESTCYHAVALGGGAPVYFVDDELVPVDSAESLFSQIENRRLVDQSLLYVEDYVENFDSAAVAGQDVIAGIPSEKRELIDEDAANLFLIKRPATSTAELWTAVDGGYVTRYSFTADGSTGDVSHTYQLLPGGSVQPPAEVSMQCFEGGFPVAPDTEPLVTGNLTHGSFRSDLTADQLQLFYDEALIPTWESISNSPAGGRVYSRTLDSGSECRLGLQFQRTGEQTIMTARVVPAVVTEAAFADITSEFSSPVVIQTAANFAFSLEGDVQDALNDVLPDLESDGWMQRGELTDIRETSAFVTLRKDDVEMHVIIDNNGANSTVRVQQRDPICGPTFDVP